MRITYHKAAKRVLERLDRPSKERIREAIERIPTGDTKPLRGKPGYYRLRVGNWRILFCYRDPDIVFIAKIALRGSIYKGE
jgi:mRNA interferase RelE/StbE